MLRKVISDRGSVFVSNFTKALFKLEGIEANPSTAYHPITDGQTECNNQELETYLRIWVSYHQDDWSHWLRSAQARYNNIIHSSTKSSPFYSTHGYHPYDGYNPQQESVAPAADDFAAHLEKIHEEVKKALASAKERMKNTYDSRLSAFKPFSAGDMVWIASKDYPSQRPSQKLEMRRYRPFKVLSRQGASAYRIAIPFECKKRGVHDLFNPALLSPYVAPFFPSQMVPL